MKIAVLIKSVPDTSAIPEIAEDGKSIIKEDLKFVLNPYDEYALEEAVKIKESVGGEVIAVSVETHNTKQVITSALAAGADSAVIFLDPLVHQLTACGVAAALSEIIRMMGPDLVFAGRMAVDDVGFQVPERVAEILNMPHASDIIRFDLSSGKATVDREIEGGYVTMEIPLPALFTVQKGINTPRYPTMPDILQAKRKEIREIKMGDLDLDLSRMVPGLTVQSFSPSWRERQMKILEGDLKHQVKELLGLLNGTGIDLHEGS